MMTDAAALARAEQWNVAQMQWLCARGYWFTANRWGYWMESQN